MIVSAAVPVLVDIALASYVAAVVADTEIDIPPATVAGFSLKFFFAAVVAAFGIHSALGNFVVFPDISASSAAAAAAADAVFGISAEDADTFVVADAAVPDISAAVSAVDILSVVASAGMVCGIPSAPVAAVGNGLDILPVVAFADAAAVVAYIAAAGIPSVLAAAVALCVTVVAGIDVSISFFAVVDAAGTVFGIPAGVAVSILLVAAAADSTVCILPAYFPALATVPAAVGIVSETLASLVADDKDPSVVVFGDNTAPAGTYFAVADTYSAAADTYSAAAGTYSAAPGTYFFAEAVFGIPAFAGVVGTVASGFAAIEISDVSVVLPSWYFCFLSLTCGVFVHFLTTVVFLLLQPIDDIVYFVINASAEVQL